MKTQAEILLILSNVKIDLDRPSSAGSESLYRMPMFGWLLFLLDTLRWLKSGHRHWTCFIVDLHYRWRGVIFHSYVEVSIAMAVFPNRWFISENPINMDDFGVPLFWETSMSVYLKGQPPCHFVGWWKPRLAARSDDRWMVEVLLTFGADPEMKNINNEARWKNRLVDCSWVYHGKKYGKKIGWTIKIYDSLAVGWEGAKEPGVPI